MPDNDHPVVNRKAYLSSKGGPVADFLGRDQSPLSPSQWESFDDEVVRVARRTLVGRRFIPLFGPLGPGAQVTPNDVFKGRNEGVVDMLGEEAGDEVQADQRRYLPLPIIHKDFMLHWRDLAAASDIGTPLSNWGDVGNGFRDVVAAVEQLHALGFDEPYALIVSTRQFVAMNRMFENTGVLEIDQIKKLMTAGVFVSGILPEPSAVVVSTGAENLDLVVGVDMTTAYVESAKMNHHFRVLETLVLRIKRPESICVIESGQGA